jgi:hypothetical protein
MDASKKSIEVEVSTVGSDNSLDHLGNFNICLTWYLNFTDNSLGSSLSYLITKVLPVLILVVGHCGLNLAEDITSIDKEILTNVIGETSWAIEDLNHLLELCPVSLNVRAVLHASFDLLEEISEFFHSCNDL